jgi:radical SAM protein with 4Fe4S-binding SPASM domain
LNTAEAIAVIEDAAQSGVKHIGFSGGEIFLRKDALQLIGKASELGMTTSVVSNGSLLTDEVIGELSHCQTLVILSIDGAKRETHEKIRGEGAWTSAITAAEKMAQAKLNFSTTMAVNKINQAEVAGYLSLSKELGAIGGCLIPVMPAGRASLEITLSPAEMLAVLKAAEEAVERLKFWLSLWCTPFARLVVKSRRIFADFCRSSNNEMDVSPQGEVLLCDVLDFNLSNVKNGVEKAFQEQETNPLVKSLSQPKKLPLPCLDCPLRRKCRGGCFARAKLANGDINAADPLCPRVAGLI